jgi:hypothetical protein
VRPSSNFLGRHHDVFADILAWICIFPSSRGHDGDPMAIGIARTRARKERLAVIGVIRVLGHKRRADDVIADLESGRDRDVGRSHILTCRIVWRVGKHSSEEGVFSMAVVDEFAEAPWVPLKSAQTRVGRDFAADNRVSRLAMPIFFALHSDAQDTAAAAQL